MSLSVKGSIKQKLELEQGTSKAGKEWKSQSFVVNTGAQYNPDVCFKLFGEEKKQRDNLNDLMDEVEVAFEQMIKNRMENGLHLQMLGKLTKYNQETLHKL